MNITGHFIYEYNGTIDELFEREHIAKSTLKKIGHSQVKTIEYLRKVIVASDLKLFNKNNPIALDFDSLYEVFPDEMNTDFTNQKIEFKLKSKQVELIDLKGINVTFSNHLKEIKNIEIPKNYRLYKN